MSKLIPLLVVSTGLSERDIRSIVMNAPARYKTYEIPKRVKGTRLISQPAREVKLLQGVLVENILGHLPVHSAATAYRRNISIKQNVEAHAGSGPILKFDFENFFPSIVASDWRRYCEKNSIFDDLEDISISTQILFHKAKRGTI